MDYKRTSEKRFQDLPDYPFSPNYMEVGSNDELQPHGLRLHYVDENKEAATETVLLLHGEPSWSFLYRKMIPVFKEAGHRVIAPDFIGFGKSDKPTNVDDYSYKLHVDWMTEFINSLDLKNITLFCQDWGGLIGLRLVAEQPERFKRVVAANTFLLTGEMPMPKAFLDWQKYALTTPQLNIGKIITKSCVKPLDEGIVAAYDAPFPDESYKAGARVFPKLVPTSPEDPANAATKKAWEVLSKWQKPFLTLFSDKDPISKGADMLFHNIVPGCNGMPHETINDAGHFLQEEKGEIIAQKVVDFMQKH